MAGYDYRIAALTPGDLAAVAFDMGIGMGQDMIGHGCRHDSGLEVETLADFHVLTWRPVLDDGKLFATRGEAVAAALAEHGPDGAGPDGLTMYGHAVTLGAETDGRVIASMPDIPGCMVYGDTRDEAIGNLARLVCRVLLERASHGEAVAAALAEFGEEE